ncbi:hypothetical protein GCM10025857_37240 [Alicyclobacillus contaminans]|uniref:Spo0B domain-containing protein n=1 Tax=Alicyclobacillus contaminans TaxID=392016 RepID=UPI0003F6E829|nr:Spo0B domain-containing protein [Alicyclobacillus contaminans]GMA52367.1 hypothetical protein GCM10025857_37240 [Alicyclobacillus contaminans]
MDPVSVRPEDALRRHRHDILNDLQLVKAYIQLGKPDRALGAVDKLVNWLQSLSSIHAITPSPLLWTLVQCPAVRWRFDTPISDWSTEEVGELCDLARTVNEAAQDAGLGVIRVVCTGRQDDRKLQIELHMGEELRNLWDNVSTVQRTSIQLSAVWLKDAAREF